MDAELDAALGRLRYRRLAPAQAAGVTAGYRHGRRNRRLLVPFGPVTISVPWRSASLAPSAVPSWSHSKSRI